MDNHQTGDFYGSIAHKYHWFFSSWNNAMERQMKELVPILKEFQVESVLDCACGTGLQTIGLTKEGFRVTGSDLSNEMLKVARENAAEEGLSEVVFFQSDFREIDSKVSTTYDAVVCMGNSIPHLKTDEDIVKAFESIYNCLNTRGVAVFDIRNFDNMLLNKDRFLPMRINSVKEDKSVSILYVFDYLENLIRFNVVYLVEDLDSGNKSMDVEVIEYNPISAKKFKELLREVGFKNIQQTEVGANIHFIVEKL